MAVSDVVLGDLHEIILLEHLLSVPLLTKETFECDLEIAARTMAVS